jgi:hypothetical protein
MLNTPAFLPTPVLSANGTDTSIFVVFNYNLAGGNYGVYGLGFDNNAYVLRTPWNVGTFGTAIIDTASYFSSRISFAFTSTQAAPQLYCILRSGASHFFYQFGSLTASNLSSTGTVGTNSQTFGIGGGIADGVYFNSFISEMIIYNVALTTIQRQEVEGYLAWKWGTQASLPATHPYYSGAPSSATTPPTSPTISITTGTATLGWTAVSGATSNYWVLYRSATSNYNGTSNASGSTAGSATAPTSAPTGLSAGYYWYFTVYASNAGGVSTVAASSIVSY